MDFYALLQTSLECFWALLQLVCSIESIVHEHAIPVCEFKLLFQATKQVSTYTFVSVPPPSRLEALVPPIQLVRRFDSLFIYSTHSFLQSI